MHTIFVILILWQCKELTIYRSVITIPSETDTESNDIVIESSNLYNNIICNCFSVTIKSYILHIYIVIINNYFKLLININKF